MVGLRVGGAWVTHGWILVAAVVGALGGCKRGAHSGATASSAEQAGDRDASSDAVLPMSDGMPTASAQVPSSDPVRPATDCSDAHSCTIDTFTASGCEYLIGPNLGDTACPAGEFCTLESGCVPAPACATNEDCAESWDGDACKAAVRCDPVSSVCTFTLLDKDADGHSPPVCGGDDCDDSTAEIHPGAIEVCDLIDNDCDTDLERQAECADPHRTCIASVCECRDEYLCDLVCVSDFETNLYHCGQCGNACPRGGTCVAGACSCPDDAVVCANGGSGECIELAVDWANCGECGKACPGLPGDSSCVSGECVCLDGGSVCEDGCFDLQTDVAHCGTCDTQCAAIEYCVDARCTAEASPLAVSAGFAHTCAITTEGALWCWGDNFVGKLGDGTTETRTEPVAVVSMGKDVAAVSAGYNNTCAIKADERLWCWGDYSEPVRVSDAIKSVAVGLHGDAVDTEGTLWHWDDDSWVPVEPAVLGTDFESVSSSRLHSCGIKLDGTLWCWGRNENGELGDGTKDDRSTPAEVVGLGGSVAAVGLGFGHSCALQVDGTLWCWGTNVNDRLGGAVDSSSQESLVPVQVSSLGAQVSAVTAGDTHTCVIKTDGGLWCWGNNEAGRLGIGTLDDSALPTKVNLGSAVVAVDAGGAHTCGISATGLWCWGSSDQGQLGTGSTGSSRSPTRVLLPPNGGLAH